MTTKTLFKSVLAAAALGVALVQTPAHAETGFSALAGIDAEPMNAAEMEATQGKCGGPLAGICSPTFRASLIAATLPGQSQRILGQFRLANPAIFAPNVLGRSAVSNAYLPYPIYLNSLLARGIQANAFPLMNQIIGNGFRSGVAPFLGLR